MVKIIFLKKNEIEEIVNQNICSNGSYSELVYSEVFSDEQILIKNNETILEVLEMEQVMNIIENIYNVFIKSYDVYEISDIGDGFAFNLN